MNKVSTSYDTYSSSGKVQRERLFSFEPKNKKLEVLISKAHKRGEVSDSYKTPIINLSSIKLTLEESPDLHCQNNYCEILAPSSISFNTLFKYLKQLP